MTPRRWPLALIAAPAAVAVWSGWVGLGELAGFGIVHPLPGIAPNFEINSAITLPVGVEAYAAYALRCWLASGTPPAAQTFAKRSAIGALALGMLGQVCYHLLAAEHAQRAPAPVVVLVACLPVAVLGLAAALTHLLHTGQECAQEQTQEGLDEAAERGQDQPGGHAPELPQFAVPEGDRLAAMFRPELEAGELPGVRMIKRRARTGTPRAQDIRSHLQGAREHPDPGMGSYSGDRAEVATACEHRRVTDCRCTVLQSRGAIPYRAEPAGWGRSAHTSCPHWPAVRFGRGAARRTDPVPR